MKGKEVTIPKDGNSSSKFEELGIALSCCGGGMRYREVVVGG